LKKLVARYKLECITAALCGSICLAFFFPAIQDWVQRIWASDEVIVYHRRIGRPLMVGNSARDAVETRLKELHASLSTEDGLLIDGRVAEDLEEKLSNLPEERALNIKKLYRSFYAADLQQADLKGIDFRGLSLIHVDFSGADLTGARFDGAQLEGAIFAKADLTGATFGTRPADAQMAGWPAGGNAPGARFHGCNFEGQLLAGRLHGASFRDAKLRSATIRLRDGEGIDFSGADLEGAAIEIFPPAPSRSGEVPEGPSFYATVRYDENTKVKGLRLAGVSDPAAPFISWALERGVVLAELPPVPPESFILNIQAVGPSRDTHGR